MADEATGSSDLRRDPAAWRISFKEKATDRFLDLLGMFSSGFSGVGNAIEDGLGFSVWGFEIGESITKRFFDLNGIDLEEPGALIFVNDVYWVSQMQRLESERDEDEDDEEQDLFRGLGAQSDV